ncbi:hypothetical protein QMK54_06520 [Pseudomonas sp. P5_109]|jgi:hypothetical protein|uniref:hypothetical protein n=1 Tax=unclassified Pseudomonas TaxID=196821 RepID=UPI001CBAD2D5|nr:MULTISPECIES: hypothetical protein [unclassified Pseudomonas]WPN31406.1 hypothetical protein QMK54_06520 [Pseudomonas sp. P5_109]
MKTSRSENGWPVSDRGDVPSVSGRLNGILKVQGERDTDVTATGLYFHWFKDPTYFFLLVEDNKIGMELILRGDELEAGKRYVIDMKNPSDVEASLLWKGSAGQSESDKVGELHVRFITPEGDFERIDGDFDFEYTETGVGFERKVGFSCLNFSLKVPNKKIS